MEDTLKHLHISIRNVVPTACRAAFDEAVDHSLSRFSTTERLHGLTPIQKLSVLENVVDILSQQCDEREHTHADIKLLVLPLMFKLSKSLIKLHGSSGKANGNKTSTSKTEEVADKALRTTDKQSKDKQPNSKIKPSSSDRESGNIPFDSEVVYKELDHFKTKGHPFRTLAHVHCKANACGFCLALFSHVNLTACSGHKRCVPSGWFPHVGKALWLKIRKIHDSGAEYTARNTACKPHEKPCMANRDVDEHMATDVDSASNCTDRLSMCATSLDDSDHASTVVADNADAESVSNYSTWSDVSAYTPVTPVPVGRSSNVLKSYGEVLQSVRSVTSPSRTSPGRKHGPKVKRIDKSSKRADF